MIRGGPHADRVARWLGDSRAVVTPSTALFEVYRLLKRDASEEAALRAVAQMLRTNVVPLNPTLALEAADASLAHALALADAVSWATARSRRAELVTAQPGLTGLPGVVGLSGKKA